MLTLSTETPQTYFTRDQAERICAQCTADETEGWTYKVEDVNNSKGLVVIRVYDETGHSLGYF